MAGAEYLMASERVDEYSIDDIDEREESRLDDQAMQVLQRLTGIEELRADALAINDIDTILDMIARATHSGTLTDDRRARLRDALSGMPLNDGIRRAIGTTRTSIYTNSGEIQLLRELTEVSHEEQKAVEPLLAVEIPEEAILARPVVPTLQLTPRARVRRQAASVRQEKEEEPSPSDLAADDEHDTLEELKTTYLSDDAVRDYLRQVGKSPLLKAEEETELSRAIEVGLVAEHHLATRQDLSPRDEADLRYLVQEGKIAKERMINSNLRLVVSVAKRYARNGNLDMIDLIQEGNTGLIRAVEKFDYMKGFKFSTYATWWIRQAITRAIPEQGYMVRLPVHAYEKVQKMYTVTKQMTADLGREPTDAELAAALGLPIKKLLELRNTSKPIMSLNTPMGEDGDSELGDLLEDTSSNGSTGEVATNGLFSQELSVALDGLMGIFLPSNRYEDVLRMRYGLDGGKPMTLEEVGQILGVTRERVRQMEQKALTMLRKQKGELQGFMEQLEA